MQEFVPRTEGAVRLYSCGPTVYDYATIGNFRTFIFVDVLRRTLSALGYDVRHMMNITDVGHLASDSDEGEDKMVAGARREGTTVWEIAAFYTERFFADAAALNLLRPHVVAKATEHIADMIALIRRLEECGFTYVAGGNVFFDVARFAALRRAGAARPPEAAGRCPYQRRPVEAQPGGLRPLVYPVEVREPGDDLGLALGARLPGVAHRVQRHERCVICRNSSTSTAAASI